MNGVLFYEFFKICQITKAIVHVVIATALHMTAWFGRS